MNDKTCFFIGNRNTPNSIREKLVEVVEKHIMEYCVKIFTVGHYGLFDSLVIEVLREAKKRYPFIELYLLSPYALNQNRKVPDGFNSTVYPEGLETVPKPFAIVYANRFLIQNSDYLITYCHGIGNTSKFVKYAQRREKKGLIKVTLL